jgi:FkbM family methyltransferase
MVEYRVSYAQNREDILIGGFFPDVAAGHYVDVGASHPDDLSVTKLFYDQGWRGINIEPIPRLADALRTARPDDITIEAAVGAEPGEATLREYSGYGLSTLNTDLMAAHAEKPTEWTTDFTDYTVAVTTLASVLAEHALPQIHFLKVDAEGTEYDVIRGNDWQRFRPELICIETEHIQRDWTGILTEAGYEEVFHDGLNAYLLATEARHRAGHFRYSDVILAKPTVVPPAAANELDAAAQLRVDNITLQGDKLALQTEKLAVQNEILALQESAAAEHAAVVELQAAAADLRGQVEVLEAAVAAETQLRAMYAARDGELTHRLATTEAMLAEIIGSRSWRMTYPMRRSIDILRARAPRRLLTHVWRRVRARRQTAAVSSASIAVPKGESPGAFLSADGKDVLDQLTRMSGDG